ncbi:hypothetical protein [Rahnella inusitata]|uniref:hypothetical protein n=1 Tax=Rahnella inusitata TaxID=58169 RepID=UPI0039AFE280
MSKQLMFRAETLKPVMMDLKTNGGALLLVGEEGIFLTAEKPSYVGAKRTIAYAEGFDLEHWDDIGELFVAMDEATGIEGAMLEVLNVEPAMLELLTSRVADLTVSIDGGEFSLRAAVCETGKTA